MITIIITIFLSQLYALYNIHILSKLNINSKAVLIHTYKLQVHISIFKSHI